MCSRTSKLGKYKKDDASFVVQDTLSKYAPPKVFSVVASSKDIKLVLAIGAHNNIEDGILDVWKAYPSTPLPSELRGKIYLRLPKDLGYGPNKFALM